MKTERCISLTHLHLFLTKNVIKLLSIGFNTSSLFCQPRLTRKIIRLYFLQPNSAVKKLTSLLGGPFDKSHLICQPGPSCWKKSPLICRPGPARWKNHSSFPGPGRWKNNLSSAGRECRVRASGQARTLSKLLLQSSNEKRFRLIDCQILFSKFLDRSTDQTSQHSKLPIRLR